MSNWGQERVHGPGEPYREGGSPVKDLASGFMDEAKRFLRAEIALARADLKDEVKKVQKGSTSVGIGAGLAVAGGLTLCAFLVLALATFMPAWAAALIVGAVLCGIGAILAKGGLARIKTADANKPKVRLEEDRQWLTSTIQKAKTAAHSNGKRTPHASA